MLRIAGHGYEVACDDRGAVYRSSTEGRRKREVWSEGS